MMQSMETMSILPKLLLYNDWYAGTHTKWHCRTESVGGHTMSVRGSEWVRDWCSEGCGFPAPAGQSR